MTYIKKYWKRSVTPSEDQLEQVLIANLPYFPKYFFLFFLIRKCSQNESISLLVNPMYTTAFL